MARATLSALAAVLLFAAACSAKSDVLVLTHKNFDEEVAKHDFMVVEFYAPWCGHCKKLEPEYDKAAATLKKDGDNIVLAKCDASDDSNRPLGERFGVRGFPTLKIFRKGMDPIEYNGPREAEGIVSYVRKQSGPASVELKTKEEFEAFKAKEEAVFVGVFPGGASGAEYEAYTALATAARDDFVFGHATDASIVEGDAVKVPTLIVFKSFDEGRADTTEFADATKLREWADAKASPLVVELSQNPKNRNALRKLFEKPVAKMLGFFDADSETAVREAMAAAAKKHEGLRFVVVGAVENAQALKYFGLEETPMPSVVIHDAPTDKKYVRQGVDLAEVDSMIAAWKAGELKQTVKSEEVPADNDGPVTVLVAKAWEQQVTTGKTYLLEFYAPWCGHCKTLAPIYEEVGAHFKDRKDVVIAKMDATANDVTDSRFDVKGFPTLYLLTKDGQAMAYSGGRTKDELIKFVEENAGAAAAGGDAELKDEL